jgi:hypothetical protein
MLEFNTLCPLPSMFVVIAIETDLKQRLSQTLMNEHN